MLDVITCVDCEALLKTPQATSLATLSCQFHNPCVSCKAFVDSMGNRMDYQVATDDNNFMSAVWLEGTKDEGIPRSFAVDQEGRIAWIGHPKHLGDVLFEVVNQTWKINEAVAARNLNRYLDRLDDPVNYELMKYRGDPYNADDFGYPDSTLLLPRGEWPEAVNFIFLFSFITRCWL